jgi:SAM-dependent methyltransferase
MQTGCYRLTKGMQCPVCNGSPRPLFTKHGFDICECAGCGHQMAEPGDWSTHIARTYGDNYFTGGGAGYSNYLSEGPLLRAAGRRYGRLIARHTEPGGILDVGAAAGFVLKGFEDCGWRGTGVEPNATMAGYARNVLGIRVVAGDLESARFNEEFDAVSIIQVIGHLRDPLEALRITARLVRSGGFVLIESWNRGSLTARAFGRRWHEYSPPTVLHWFSLAGLCRLGGAAGLEVVKRGRPLKMLNGGHTRSLLKYKLSNRPLGTAASRLLDLLPGQMPMIYPFDDIFWLLLRKP